MSPIIGPPLFAVAAQAAPAAAQSCARHVGTLAVPVSVGGLAATLPRIGAKGEFETSAAYDARVAAAAGRIGSSVIVEKRIRNLADPASVAYDADAGRLTIRASAFAWGNMYWSIAFASAGPGGPRPGVGRGIGTRLTSASRETGSYVGSNAFGASRRIGTADATTTAVWARPAADADDAMFAQGDDAVLGTIAMTAAEARTVKPALRFALEVSPRAPFVVAGALPATLATFDDPRSTSERFQILIGDVRCGLVMNADGKVIAAYPANPPR